MTREAYAGPFVIGTDLMRFDIGRSVVVEGSTLDDVELQRPAP